MPYILSKITINKGNFKLFQHFYKKNKNKNYNIFLKNI